MTQRNAYALKMKVGKNSNAIFSSFMKKRISNVNAIAKTTVIHTSENMRLCNLKKQSTNSTLKIPSTAKNILDGKKCLKCTSLLTDRIDEM